MPNIKGKVRGVLHPNQEVLGVSRVNPNRGGGSRKRFEQGNPK